MQKSQFAFWGNMETCQEYNEKRRRLITDNWKLGLKEVKKLGRYPNKSDGSMYGWWERVLITMDNNSANQEEFDAMIELCNEIDPSIIKESWKPEKEIIWQKPIKFTYKQINNIVMFVLLALSVVFGILGYLNFGNPARSDFVTVSGEAFILLTSCSALWFFGNKAIWISILSDYEYRTASRDGLDFLIKLSAGINICWWVILKIISYCFPTFFTNVDWKGFTLKLGEGSLSTLTIFSPIITLLIAIPFIMLFLVIRKTRFKIGLSDMRWYIALLFICFTSIVGIAMFCVGLIFGRLIWMTYWKKIFGSVPKYKIPLIPIYTFYWITGLFFTIFLIPIFLHM